MGNIKRSLTSHARDISELAKHLGISKYHVFGQSGGGPYAVAAAAYLKDEVLGAGVVCGMSPPEVVTIQETGTYTYFALGVDAVFPRLMTAVSDFFSPPTY